MNDQKVIAKIIITQTKPAILANENNINKFKIFLAKTILEYGGGYCDIDFKIVEEWKAEEYAIRDRNRRAIAKEELKLKELNKIIK
jgi:hypothetical protein